MAFPTLHSERLILRQVVSDDAPVVLKGYSDTAVNQFMSVSYHSLEDVQIQLNWYNDLFHQGSGYWWGICLKNTGEMIGNGGFHLWNNKFNSAELGYWILPEFQGNGLASEAVQEMMKFGYNQMNLHRIEAIVEKGNISSSKMLGSLGFQLEGVRRECEWVDHKYISLEIWSKLSTDY